MKRTAQKLPPLSQTPREPKQSVPAQLTTQKYSPIVMQPHQNPDKIPTVAISWSPLIHKDEAAEAKDYGYSFNAKRVG